MFSESFTASLRDSLILFAAVAAIVTALAALYAWRLSRSSGGLRRASAAALVTIAIGTVALTYWWHFLDTFYRMRVSDAGIELELALPERRVLIPRGDVAGFAIEPALQGAARLVVRTVDGRRYYSPSAPHRNRVDTIERLQTILQPDMDHIAERYVRLVLEVGQHDPGFVDAYYGPEAFRPEGDARPPLDELLAEAAALQTDVAAASPGPDADAATRLRQQYLAHQLQAVHTRIRMLQGERFTFDEESRLLYDATAPHNTEADFQTVLDEVETLLPGDGPLIDRYEAFRSQFVIPPARLDRVFTIAIDECRRRTSEHITLPAGETFSVEYVTGKSWSAYNWYKGGFRSVIQVNTDLPITIDRAIDLACHEGYPGHHVYNALLEKSLVRDRRWIEFSIYPLFSPQSLIAEGTANYGIQVAFPGETRVAWEKETLFPAAGLDANRAQAFYDVQSRIERLSYAGNEAARRYLNGEITREEAAAWLQRYAMMPRDRAEQRTRFFDQYRSYVINYNLGKDLVKDWIEQQASSPNQHWTVFEQLLSSPRLPSGLR